MTGACPLFLSVVSDRSGTSQTVGNYSTPLECWRCTGAATQLQEEGNEQRRGGGSGQRRAQRSPPRSPQAIDRKRVDCWQLQLFSRMLMRWVSL